MSVSFNGFGENAATFKTEADIPSGKAVKIIASNTVAPCADGEVFCGFVINGEDGYACVQLCGTVETAYTGAAPALGFTKLAASAGGVKAASNGREYLVLAVDDAARIVAFLM